MTVLAVALHDVEPATFERCVEIRAWLRARGVTRLTLLVVPAPALRAFHELRPELADWLRARVSAGDAVAQHGLRHRRTHRRLGLPDPRARVLGGPAAEFAGLGTDAVAHALDAGRARMLEAGLPARGFVAPAYYYTPALRSALAHRFDWWAGLWRVHGPELRAPALCLGTSTALKRATSPALTRLGLGLAGPLLRLDVHPADFDLAGHVATIEHVLERGRGRRPVTYDELVSRASSRRTAATGARRREA